MKTNWITRTLTLTGVSALFATISFAAPNLTAKVEFPFFAKDASLAPGTYRIYTKYSGGGKVFFILRNTATGKKVAVTPFVSNMATAGQETKARLVFDCAGEGCRLMQIWNGENMHHDFGISAPAVTNVYMHPGP